MIEHHHYILNVMCVMQCNIINVLHTEHNNGPVCYCCWVKIQKKKNGVKQTTHLMSIRKYHSYTIAVYTHHTLAVGYVN